MQGAQTVPKDERQQSKFLKRLHRKSRVLKKWRHSATQKLLLTGLGPVAFDLSRTALIACCGDLLPLGKLQLFHVVITSRSLIWSIRHGSLSKQSVVNIQRSFHCQRDAVLITRRRPGERTDNTEVNISYEVGTYDQSQANNNHMTAIDVSSIFSIVITQAINLHRWDIPATRMGTHISAVMGAMSR